MRRENPSDDSRSRLYFLSEKLVGKDERTKGKEGQLSLSRVSLLVSNSQGDGPEPRRLLDHRMYSSADRSSYLLQESKVEPVPERDWDELGRKESLAEIVPGLLLLVHPSPDFGIQRSGSSSEDGIFEFCIRSP